MKATTVSVNGTVYDSRTGKPLRVERGHDTPSRHSAVHVHMQPQKSKTLNRKYVHHDPVVVAEPQPSPAKPLIVTSHHKLNTPTSQPRHQDVRRFATPGAPARTAVRVMSDVGVIKHVIADRAEQRLSAKQPVEHVVKPSQVLKNEAIAQAMRQAPTKTSKKERSPAPRGKFKRFTSIASASLAILLLGAYLTYLNMPALSTRIAATQAGINASYPSYQPTGYSLSGPVAYQQGSVTMKFAANAGPENYTLAQARSDWDSTAVLENYVAPKAGDNYTTTTTSGLTIYSFGNTSTWVNGGILYTITGNAPLSNDQVQRIATSL